jgi:hypothetical protein
MEKNSHLEFLKTISIYDSNGKLLICKSMRDHRVLNLLKSQKLQRIQTFNTERDLLHGVVFNNQT